MLFIETTYGYMPCYILRWDLGCPPPGGSSWCPPASVDLLSALLMTYVRLTRIEFFFQRVFC